MTPTIHSRHLWWSTSNCSQLLFLFGLAIIVRFPVLWNSSASILVDTDGYVALADNLNAHGVYGTGKKPTAYRPPLYPLLLAVVQRLPFAKLVAIGILHLVLGLVTIYLVLRLAEDWEIGSRALIAPTLVILDPILIHHSTKPMSETLATCCATLCLTCLTRASRQQSWSAMALVGLTFGISSLCRPHFLAWMLIITMYLIWTAMHCQERWPRIVALVGTCGLALAPWTLRNELFLDRPVITTTHGGYTFLLGNNSSFYAYLRQQRWGETWNASGVIPSRHDVQDECQYDRTCYQRAWQSIRKEPGIAAWAALVKAGRLWCPLPHQQHENESVTSHLMRYCVAGWYTTVFGLALYGVWTQRSFLARFPWVWVVFMCLAWTAVHTFYWSNLRMRAPLIPGISLLAALGANSLPIWQKKTDQSLPV